VVILTTQGQKDNEDSAVSNVRRASIVHLKKEKKKKQCLH